MLNRFSALWLVLGAIVGGYAVAGPSVTAQGSAVGLPFAVEPGTTVRLTFEGGTFAEGPHYVTCTVAAVQPEWIRCRAADSFQDEREQRWYRLKRLIQITKQER